MSGHWVTPSLRGSRSGRGCWRNVGLASVGRFHPLAEEGERKGEGGREGNQSQWDDMMEWGSVPYLSRSEALFIKESQHPFTRLQIIYHTTTSSGLYMLCTHITYMFNQFTDDGIVEVIDMFPLNILWRIWIWGGIITGSLAVHIHTPLWCIPPAQIWGWVQ